MTFLLFARAIFSFLQIKHLVILRGRANAQDGAFSSRKTKGQILLVIIKGGRGLSLRIPDNRITGVLPVRVEWPMHF